MLNQLMTHMNREIQWCYFIKDILNNTKWQFNNTLIVEILVDVQQYITNFTLYSQSELSFANKLETEMLEISAPIK